MKQIKTKALSMLMAAVMVFAMAPLGTGIAFAAEDDEGQPVVTNEEAPVADEELPAAEEEVTEEEVVGEEAPEAEVNEEPAVKAAGDDETAAEYKLWIGGVQVTSETTSGEGWTYVGNETKGTLTLNNATITDFFSDLGNDICISAMNIDLTLKLEGINIVGDGNEDYAIEVVGGDLTVEGTGTLNVFGGFNAIYAERGLTINSGNVTVKTDSERAGTCAVHAPRLSVNGGTLTTETKYGEAIRTENLIVKNSTLYATSTGKYADGIRANESIDISNATVIAKATNDEGGIAIFWNGGDCKINNGTVEAESKGGAALTFGIEESGLRGDLIINDSTVTALGAIQTIDNITIKNSTVSAECESYGYYGPETILGHMISIENSQVDAKGSHFGIAAIKADDFGGMEEPADESTYKINIKDSKVTAESVYGIAAMGEINMSYTGKGKYATRVEAIAAEPETPAIFSKKINKGNNLKVVLPKGGIIKSVPNEGIETIYDASVIADHVIIEPVKTQTTPKKEVKPVFFAKMTAKGKKSLKIEWDRLNNAGGYDIYMSYCNVGSKKHTPKLVKTVKGSATTSWKKSGLKKKRGYKVYVKAWKMQKGKKIYIAQSPLVHAYTSGVRGKYTNAKSVSVNKSSVSLNAGGRFTIYAKVNKVKKNKKLMPITHTTVLRYMSSNSGVAAVSKAGIITAKGKGTCKIYVYTANGARQAVTVNVR
ncbi:MAG: hypothetical protein IJH05_09045 [Firmicutes bacterium]|nr:hypothetical protein [Bacillota bacterium]